MKKLLLTFMAFAGMMLVAGSGNAVDRAFVVSATVPNAQGITITASSVNPSNNQFTTVTGNALSFDPMSFNATNGIFLPNHFFAIDIGATGGAGNPNITLTYVEGANPNGVNKGLGWKSTATFLKVSGSGASQVEAPLTNHGPKKLMKDVVGEQVTSAELASGFFRLYLGIFTGDPNATYPEPATGEPFTPADAPGRYDGTLVISATLP